MVVFRAIPINLHISIHRSETNCGPRSEVITAGTPHIAIQRRISIFAHALALAAYPGIIIGKSICPSVNDSK